jgi:hypothetical protein
MATMIYPDLSENEIDSLESQAEARIYRKIRNVVPKSYLVLFQVAWIASKDAAGYTDGEIDFVICDPKRGFISLEVKGGGVSLSSVDGKWYSIDRNGTKNSIKDPIKQSLNAKYAILRKLKQFNKFSTFPFQNSAMGHAVFFPDIKFNSSLIKSDISKEMIGTAEDVDDISVWIERAFEYISGSEIIGPGEKGLELMINSFIRSMNSPALNSANLAAAEKKMINLTSNQLKLLSFIRSRRRAIISGGAGTGKTVLALEKARELAKDGFSTLVTCYNRPLADFLRESLADEAKITVLTVHQVATRFIDAAKIKSHKDLMSEVSATYPEGDKWDVQMPIALWDAADYVDTRFDAIVCDEGQDIPEDFWMPLQRILSDFDNSPFFIFRDENQDIYRRTTSNVFEELPFNLDINCRNTFEIHEYAYKYYRGPNIAAPVKSNVPIEFINKRGLIEQSEIILKKVRELVLDPGIIPSDVVVLVSSATNLLKMRNELASTPISKQIGWTMNHQRGANEVLIESVKRFKGLESRIVVFWLDDSGLTPVAGEEVYVGASRARSQLIVVSESEIDKGI